jgi:hypothetical protein
MMSSFRKVSIYFSNFHIIYVFIQISYKYWNNLLNNLLIFFPVLVVPFYKQALLKFTKNVQSDHFLSPNRVRLTKRLHGLVFGSTYGHLRFSLSWRQVQNKRFFVLALGDGRTNKTHKKNDFYEFGLSQVWQFLV